MRLLVAIFLLGPVWGSEDAPLNELVGGLLDFYIPRSSANQECREHSELYFKEAIAKTRWAQQMFDSSAKVPGVGLLRGSVYELGQYDECVETAAPELPFEPRYCLLDVRMNLTEQSVVSDLVSRQRLRWAFCVPSSCSNDDVTGHVQAALAAMLESSGTAEVSVKEKNCRNRVEDYDFLDASEITTIVFFGLIVLLCVVATAVDLYETKWLKKKEPKDMSVGKTVLNAFSAYKNGKSIINIHQVHGSIDCINGLRWYSMVWIIVGHKYGKQLEVPYINRTDILHGLMNDWMQMILMNSYLAIDTFFVISGLLCSFLFMNAIETQRKFNIFKFYVHRYIRMAPALAATVLIYAHLLEHTGNGPIWYEYVEKKAVNCQERWWTTLLFVNNYVHPRSDQTCVPQTWYLSVDMQFFVFSPALMYPLWRWPKAGYVFSFVLLVVGLFVPAYITAVNEYPWIPAWNESSEEKMEYFVNMYCVAWTRIVPYLVGIVFGYFLFRIQDKKIRIRPVLVVLGWVVAMATGLAIVYTLHIYYKPSYTYSEADAATYNSLHHLGWALFICWVIFACHHGYGGIINHMLSWQFLQPFAKLQYSCELMHILILLADIATSRSNSYYSHYNTVKEIPGDFMFILLAAMALSLTCELPFMNLERAYVQGKFFRKKLTESAYLEELEHEARAEQEVRVENQVRPESQEEKMEGGMTKAEEAARF